jgi:hypothetical protein
MWWFLLDIEYKKYPESVNYILKEKGEEEPKLTLPEVKEDLALTIPRVRCLISY